MFEIRAKILHHRWIHQTLTSSSLSTTVLLPVPTATFPPHSPCARMCFFLCCPLVPPLDVVPCAAAALCARRSSVRRRPTMCTAILVTVVAGPRRRWTRRALLLAAVPDRCGSRRPTPTAILAARVAPCSPPRATPMPSAPSPPTLTRRHFTRCTAAAIAACPSLREEVTPKKTTTSSPFKSQMLRCFIRIIALAQSKCGS